MLKFFKFRSKRKYPKGKNRSTLFLDAQHGLGNRLRAVASAACVAQKTNRHLVIIWEPDHHCFCRMSDLFKYSGEVLDRSFVSEADRSGMSLFNYMEIEQGSSKDAYIAPDIVGDLYVRSAYPINSPLTSWREENNFLKSLDPSEPVSTLLSSVPARYELGVHIRMIGGDSAQHLSYEQKSNWTQVGHEEIEFWRNKSHYSNFVNRIDEVLGKRNVNRFFLAADNPDAYRFFLDRYDERVTVLTRDRYDRSAEQLRYALADAMLLSRSSVLLGSNWSSFTELAVRLSQNKLKPELAGINF